VLDQARWKHALASASLTGDGIGSEAGATLKRVKPKTAFSSTGPSDEPGNPRVEFRGEKRSNATSASSTDPDARVSKQSKRQEAKREIWGMG
jgi:hypothetical protein